MSDPIVLKRPGARIDLAACYAYKGFKRLKQCGALSA